MNRRQQLEPLIPDLLDIYGDDLGATVIAHLNAVAWQLDENDRLIGHADNLTHEDGYSLRDIIADLDPNADYHMPDVGCTS